MTVRGQDGGQKTGYFMSGIKKKKRKLDTKHGRRITYLTKVQSDV